MTAKKQTIKKVLKTIWITAGIVFTLWLFYSSESHEVSDQSLEESATIKTLNTDDYYSFTPKEAFKNVFIFFPGAMVDPKAYVPLCRKIAENNIQVYLIKMPWRLASKGYNKPKELHLLSDKTKTYILSGHSLGAKMAAQFVFENPELINKLILIGSTHPKTISLADCKIPILKIYGSNDGVADEKSILNNKSKLPKTAQFQKIEGANHSQFGYYGFQLGDNQASITREEQQAATFKIILKFINEK